MGDRSWNYLRVRGEYGNFLDWGYVTAELPRGAGLIPMIYCWCTGEVELPPRARRILNLE